MDRHASIRRHAGLRIAAIRRHAGLRIAGAQDHEEPALRYQVETQLVDVIRGSNPKCWTCVPAAGRSISPRPGSVQVRVQGRRRGGAATAWRACYGMQGKECWDMVKVSTAMDKDRSTGAWCTLSPVLRTWAHVHAYVYCEFGVCLAGKFAIQNFARAPHSTIQRSAPRFTYSAVHALSKLQNFRPSHEERIVGTLASTPLVLGPLPVGAGPHQAEAAWAPPTPHRLRPAGVPWERRRGWRCANSAVKRRALRGSVT